MDDLIPFLIFVAVALINLIKTAIERSGAKSAPLPTPRKATPSPQESPTTLEEFFETISDQFGMAEETEREEDFFEPKDPNIFEEKAPSVEPVPDTIISLPSEKAPAADIALLHKKPIGYAMKSIPNTLISLDAMKLPSVPLLSGAQKKTLNFPLRNRNVFKNAIIANIVFSPPRAYDSEYKNTNLS